MIEYGHLNALHVVYGRLMEALKNDDTEVVEAAQKQISAVVKLERVRRDIQEKLSIDDIPLEEALIGLKSEEDFGTRIRRARMNHGINQQGFSKLIGIAPAHLCRIEHGKQFPNEITVQKITDGLSALESGS
jgi:ribosome-binding protein aMBF1 (putative translation factor)